MSSPKDHYSISFDKEGSLRIIDFALESTSTSLPVVALRTKNSTIIAAKKEIPELLEIPCNRTIIRINEYCWMAITGRVADVDQIIYFAREIANNAIGDLGFEPTPDILSRLLADANHRFIMKTGIRAKSFTCVIFGFNETSELWQTDTSSILYPYKCIGLGQNSLKMNKYLEKNYHEDLADENALICAIKSLSESIGIDFSPNRIQVAILHRDVDIKMLSVDEIDMLLQKISETD